LNRLATAKHPRRRGVIIERALEGIDDLIIEGGLRSLRQAPHEDLHPFGSIEAPNSLRSQDVHHSRCEPAIGNDRDTLGLRLLVQLLLLQYDLSVAAEVGEVAPAFDGGAG